MPRFVPNIQLSDCWSSIGQMTFFHRNGICFWKRRSHPEFPGTLPQLEAQSIHLRALQAWRSLDPEVQEQWNDYARIVPSHRPPFINDHHISGYNLFVSGYHGFARLGNEHCPAPRPFESFPVVYCEYASASVGGDESLLLDLRTMLGGCTNPTRYRVAVRIQLTEPGRGRRPGYLRSFIATTNCSSSDCLVRIVIPNYKDIWNLDLNSYQVHMRYFLIDSETGYRNNYRKSSFTIELQ